MARVVCFSVNLCACTYGGCRVRAVQKGGDEYEKRPDGAMRLDSLQGG